MGDVKTRKISRDKLAAFLPSHELIKAFENLSEDVGTTIPANTEANKQAAAAAKTSADSAQASADLALSLIDGMVSLVAQLEELRGIVFAQAVEINGLKQGSLL